MPPEHATSRTILFVTMSLDTGGTERHLSLIAPRLRALGWRPIIFCFWRRGRLADAVESAGVEVIAPSGQGPRRWGSVSSIVALAASAGRLLKLIRQRRPHIVHFFLPLAYMLGAPIALMSRVPVTVMSRRSLNVYQRKLWAIAPAERWLHARMTALLGNSKQVIEELITQEHCPPEKVGLIYNGTDLSVSAAAEPADRTTLGVALDSLVLIVVANLIPYKGHADLLDALSQISSRLPEPWSLLCVGRDQGYGAHLRDEAVRLGIDNNIRFLGERTDIPQLLKAADIGILSSHEEGFSNAVIEGLAAGLPMIVTDVGGNAEAVTNETAGLVVPPRDPAALGHAILRLALDPSLRSNMAEAARTRAATSFTIESCVSRYDKFYHGLLKGLKPDQMTRIGVTTKPAGGDAVEAYSEYSLLHASNISTVHSTCC